MILPFADQEADGLVSVSFSLPVAASPKATAAAKAIASRMGLSAPTIAHCRPLDDNACHFTVYGTIAVGVDWDALVAPEVPTLRQRGEIEQAILNQFGRPLTVVGATTGTDTHTVGIDAILNAKGFAGEPGLESYACFEVTNLGSQIDNERLFQVSRDLDADVILVSQTVTQRRLHERNLASVVAAAAKYNMRSGRLLICGGPYISAELGTALGFDGTFSKESTARDVAQFVLENFGGRS
jgi:beta-lysine 5,6-aminomutase beta subunit